MAGPAVSVGLDAVDGCGGVLPAARDERLVARLRFVRQPGSLFAAGAGQESGIGPGEQPGAAQTGRVDLVD